MEERRKSLNYELCGKCSKDMEYFYETQNTLLPDSQKKFEIVLGDRDLIRSVHVKNKKLIQDVSEKEILDALYTGHPIEYQTTRFEGECKIIIRGGRFEEQPLHIVLLFSPLEVKPKIVTVYDPTILAWWKWDDTYSKRIYLNKFRTCCVHPYDSVKAYNKEHHDRPYHPKYKWKRELKKDYKKRDARS